MRKHTLKSVFIQLLSPSLGLLLFFCSCNGSKKQTAENTDTLVRLTAITKVAAIAKVQPENGLVNLASSQGGIVSSIQKNAGDSLVPGDVILTLAADPKTQDLLTLDKQIAAQQQRAAAELENISQYKSSLQEKEADLARSSRLAEKGADTDEQVSLKTKDRDILRANLRGAEKLAAAALADVEVLRAQRQQQKELDEDRYVRAREKGILVSLDVQVGAAIPALTSFGTLAPDGPLHMEGEIDEMFANKVSIGDKITFNYVGNSEIIAQGEVLFLAPILESKSLFYDRTGESSDRRVRRFKASFVTSSPLLINTKVECTIQIP